MRARLSVALGCVVAAALLPAFGVFQQLVSSPGWYRLRDDPISAFERRYAPLRAALGSERVVGYLAPVAQDSPAARAHFYMSRYALAPVQVVDGTEPSLVVADGIAESSRVPAELTVRRDFGGGLLLLERPQRRQP